MASLNKSNSLALISVLILSTIVGFLPVFVHAGVGFSAELIHRDSPESPFYDSTATSYSRLIAAAHRSYNRATYFREFMKQPIPPSKIFSSTASIKNNGDNIHSEILMNRTDYLLTIYMGSPVRKILAIPDTGSDLIWTQCKPCRECFQQSAPLFDPAASSTYKIVSCGTVPCSALPKSTCGRSGNQCEYNYIYGDGSFVDGFLSTETLSFDSDGGDQVRIPSILFGCTHHSRGMFQKTDTGLVGLGGGKLSLVRQLGSTIDGKFSYCLPSYSKNRTTSRFNFGTNAVVNGSGSVTTPLMAGYPDTLYFLMLEMISLDGHGEVAIKPSMPAAFPITKGNIIIDSGTTLTLVDDDTLRAVETMVASNVTLPRMNDTSGIFSLCFNFSGFVGNDVDAQFPHIKFHFSGGAVVVLRPYNAFVAVKEDTACLALVSRKDIGVNIYGSLAQQNFHIGYDLNAMRLSLKPADCANT
ncbi:Aspartic proteinase CDR1 [Platanthera guangdongensis]|uniref:Aspartic proteinase CDR1 n=1 Tax=Platanthera guangdongensis TaxID=2320717 RepID=A0ABR2LMT9_9ASPA